jgi:hypothetical protein
MTKVLGDLRDLMEKVVVVVKEMGRVMRMRMKMVVEIVKVKIKLDQKVESLKSHYKGRNLMEVKVIA